MNTTLTAPTFGRTTGPLAPLAERLAAWLSGRANDAAQYSTREDARSLYARAARYEATQPGFAADLRAAAEAMDGTAARAIR